MNTKPLTLIIVCSAFLSLSTADAQKASKKEKSSASNRATTSASAKAPSGTTGSNANLETVLTQMDNAAASFRSAEADLLWEQYQKVVDETDTQKGKIYFRRTNKETQAAIHITAPDTKDVLYTEGKVRLYQPKIDQVTEHDASKNKEAAESFLALGFGGRGHELIKQYEVRLDGNEAVDGMQTTKLELTPKSPKVRNMFDKIILWMDPQRDVSLKQQFVEPSGDYRTTRYMNIKLNGKISDDVFKLHTTAHTKVVRPQ
jgi:outer membrane lipoprotein-sorting protein